MSVAGAVGCGYGIVIATLLAGWGCRGAMDHTVMHTGSMLHFGTAQYWSRLWTSQACIRRALCMIQSPVTMSQLSRRSCSLQCVLAFDCVLAVSASCSRRVMQSSDATVQTQHSCHST
jgi:hypothetical protein